MNLPELSPAPQRVNPSNMKYASDSGLCSAFGLIVSLCVHRTTTSVAHRSVLIGWDPAGGGVSDGCVVARNYSAWGTRCCWLPPSPPAATPGSGKDEQMVDAVVFSRNTFSYLSDQKQNKGVGLTVRHRPPLFAWICSCWPKYTSHG